jgi:sarcosine oxidase
VYETDAPVGDGLPRPWIDHSEASYYGMINVAPRQHVIGLHDLDQEQHVDDPDEPVDDEIRRASIATQFDYIKRRFARTRTPRVIDVRTCHYTSTASRDFVVDGAPGLPGVILLSACSGHGFKFAITMGAYASSLAGGGTVPDRERFHLQLARMT